MAQHHIQRPAVGDDKHLLPGVVVAVPARPDDAAAMLRTLVAAAVDGLARECGDTSRVAGAAVDVRDRAAIDRLVTDAVARFGGPDVLVKNAGVGGVGEVASMSDADWHRAIDINLTGAFYCSRAAIAALRAAGEARAQHPSLHHNPVRALRLRCGLAPRGASVWAPA